MGFIGRSLYRKKNKYIYPLKIKLNKYIYCLNKKKRNKWSKISGLVIFYENKNIENIIGHKTWISVGIYSVSIMNQNTAISSILVSSDL